MPTAIQKDRRRQRARGYRLDRSALLQIPAEFAIPVLGLFLLLAVITEYLFADRVWFGPVYLVLIAISAWSVSSRFAIALGLFLISFKLLTGNEGIYPYGPNSFALNFALRFLCVLVVVLILGAARRSLEKEWRLARTDPLTGALNRQAFFEAIRGASDQEGPAILAFADLDGLKRLNDEMGHELGDDALLDFADRVRTAIRENDLFARIGGDEFVIFMKVEDTSAAKAVASRLNKVLNLEAHVDESRLKCSLGALFLPAGSKSIDTELKAADKLMYAAKKSQAGLLMASAIEVDGQTTLVAPLPADPNTVVRSEDRQPNSVAAPIGISPFEAPAVLANGKKDRAKITAIH